MAGHGHYQAMDGNAAGLYKLAAHDITAFASRRADVEIGVSFFEVYRGQVLDLPNSWWQHRWVAAEHWHDPARGVALQLYEWGRLGHFSREALQRVLTCELVTSSPQRGEDTKETVA